MILLAAPTIASNYPLCANGGAGGEGGARPQGVWLAGQPGQDGRPSEAAADGGATPADPEGDGGAGSSRLVLTGANGADAAGGAGGGGGGAGYIYVFGDWTGGGIITPPDSAP